MTDEYIVTYIRDSRNFTWTFTDMIKAVAFYLWLDANNEYYGDVMLLDTNLLSFNQEVRRDYINEYARIHNITPSELASV